MWTARVPRVKHLLITRDLLIATVSPPPPRIRRATARERGASTPHLFSGLPLSHCFLNLSPTATFSRPVATATQPVGPTTHDTTTTNLSLVLFPYCAHSAALQLHITQWARYKDVYIKYSASSPSTQHRTTQNASAARTV
jgi:hypothetical protein